jgi:hypothetical protein
MSAKAATRQNQPNRRLHECDSAKMHWVLSMPAAACVRPTSAQIILHSTLHLDVSTANVCQARLRPNPYRR